MTPQSRSLPARIPLIAALAALTLCLCAPPALARYVYTGNYNNDTVSVIDTATNQIVGEPIPAGNGPYTMAITPDGKTLYMVNDDEDITVVDTRTNQPVTTIPLGFTAATIAIAPDGKTAYLTEEGKDGVRVLDLQSNQLVGPAIVVGEDPWGVAFSPDGRTAYVANETNDDVSVIDTQTRQVAGEPIPVGEAPISIAISPDGKSAYVTNFGTDDVSVIDTQTRQVVGEPIPVGDEPWGLALTPDGSKLYVANYGAGDVSVIDTQTRQVAGEPIPVGDEPYELAVTPDGKSLYVPNFEDDTMTVIDTQSNQPTATIPVEGGPWQVAIVPDQSPTASFTATAANKLPLSLAFNGLGSTDPDGTIARYDWSFGDGTAAPNGGPIPAHSYAKAGTYSASLTVTDNEGCSVNMVFTGRTAHCSGSSAASAAQTITVPAPSKAQVPNKFKFGKLKRNARKGTAKLTVLVPAAGKLVLAGKKVKRAQRSAKKAGKVTLNIRPKPKVKKLLAQKGNAKVRVRVTFSPTGGDKLTKSKALRLIRR